MNIRSYLEQDYEILIHFMKQLYIETDGEVVDCTKINRTILESKVNPTVDIKIVQHKNTVIGYIIVILFYSNEFGGNIINLDEIYIDSAYRSLGFGSSIIGSIKDCYPDAVGLQLEVAPTNLRAKSFYVRNGLKPYTNEVLFKKF